MLQENTVYCTLYKENYLRMMFLCLLAGRANMFFNFAISNSATLRQLINAYVIHTKKQTKLTNEVKMELTDTIFSGTVTGENVWPQNGVGLS